MENSTTMESIPLEVVKIICKHLTITDLASCCATCRSWRNLFGSDMIWRSLCDRRLSAYLKTTKSVVEPVFVSPKATRSKLNPVSEWRKNFMRETHLWNNWHQGNFTQQHFNFLGENSDDKIELGGPYEKQIPVFYTNDVVAVFHDNLLDLWDVKLDPFLYATLPFPVYSNSKIQAVFKVSCSDNLVVVQDLIVQVIKISLTEKILDYVHIFSVEASEKYFNNPDEDLRCLPRKRMQSFALVDNIFVSIVVSKLSLAKLHIWDVSKGQKLKQEDIPVNRPQETLTFSPLLFCKQSKNIVVTYKQPNTESTAIRPFLPSVVSHSLVHILGGINKHFYIYSLKKMEFLPFRKAYNEPIMCVTSYVIMKEYLAVNLNDRIIVYNYVTSDLLFSLDAEEGPWLLRDNIVFYHKGVLSIIEPKTRNVQAKFNIRSNSLKGLSVVCSKFFVFSHMVGDPNIFVNKLISATDSEDSDKKVKAVVSMPIYRLYSTPSINESCTKFVLVHLKQMTLVNLW